MEEPIRVELNQAQKEKIKKVLGRDCDTLEIRKDQLIDVVKYMGPSICIDFDEAQEKLIHEHFPKKECDFAIINRSALGLMVRYMPPPR
jgi:hypothetical protein